jgi:hypothetical protein
MRRSWQALVAFAAGAAIGSACVDVTAQSRNTGTYSLTGRVLTARTSKPVPNVWVLIYEGSSLKSRSLTGDDGSYYISRLEERTYMLAVKKDLKSTETLFTAQVHVPVGRSFDIRLP